ncbi:fatty acid desaturase [uncultured Tateyamaria sp.]|uniref:fatty acid desaturase n=1 Tax=uncultured Tateyamaria sp. TaxID=455651 RepID=UPI00260FEEAC|nr:fatty acid desaturase [uncultured Tateyamaria sp.]
MPSHRSSRRLPFDRPLQVEWITLGLWVAVSGLWMSAVFVLPGLWAWAALVFALVLHASLSHEVLHGHPFPSRRLSEALVLVNPGLFVPYLRFRDTHLAHHQDANLTDPYDDPETNYVDPVVWAELPRAVQAVLALNNTLAGRMLVGPLAAQVSFMRDDCRAIRAGDRQALKGWLVHVPGVVLILAAVWASPMPVWMYLTACYVSVSVLKIRTFLEHQAHARARGRTVIVEDRGPLAFLFLNNNFHVVHHMHPRVPWYRLPALYRTNRDRYLSCNEGYRYGSYAEVFKRHFLWAKDPVPHPLWSSDR